MKMNHHKQQILKVTLVLVLSLFLAHVPIVQAQNVPDPIRQVIEQKFPGADIKEVEQEMWEGQSVTEVELTTKDGVDYQVLVSKDGEILKAEEEKGLPLIGGEFSIGMAVRGEQDIYKDVDTEFEPTPFFLFENGPLEIRAYDGIDASFSLYGNKFFTAGVMGSLMLGEGYDSDDSDYFEGMDELETLYSVGLQLDGQFAGWEAGLEILQDVSGEHDGQEVELSLVYPWMVAGLELRPELSVTWLSEESVDYFYGVSATEARADRPAYSPGSSYEIGAELMIQRPIYGNFTMIGIAGISTFGADITDSPLVDEDYEIEGTIGLMYTF